MSEQPRSSRKSAEESTGFIMFQNAPWVSTLQADRVTGLIPEAVIETLAVEEPLEIQLAFKVAADRVVKSISVTMRTPGNDCELAAGFLMTEGVIRDINDIERISHAKLQRSPVQTDTTDQKVISISHRSKNNVVRVDLFDDVPVTMTTLERNFYTTSSCGICGKASLLALRSVCPPRSKSTFDISAEVLYKLPGRMRHAQSVFEQTGGLHGAALFSSDGTMLGLREDIGRHNAVDKLLGQEFLAYRTPLREALLLLSGRASFELLQKAVMGGISMVASVGAPSSLAVTVAREFDITLLGFLRDDHFNVYHGREHVTGLIQQSGDSK